MIQKSRAREQALQVLYFIETTQSDCDDALDLFSSHFETKSSDYAYVLRLVRGVSDSQKNIDEVITDRLEKWKLSRLARIDRNILRVGTYEILFEKDVPPRVVIDEAVELGKKFGDAKTSILINGVLDRVSRDYPRV